MNKFGPARRFEEPDAVRLFLKLSKRKGRARLTKELKLGEGSVRTILAHLKKKGFVDSAPMGHKLTKKGSLTLDSLKKHFYIKNLSPTDLTSGRPSTVLLLKRVKSLPSPIILRDEAIKHGAEGCLIFKYEKGSLFMPPYHEATHKKYMNSIKKIESSFKLDEGDVLIISFSNNKNINERACWAVGFKLIKPKT